MADILGEEREEEEESKEEEELEGREEKQEEEEEEEEYCEEEEVERVREREDSLQAPGDRQMDQQRYFQGDRSPGRRHRREEQKELKQQQQQKQQNKHIQQQKQQNKQNQQQLYPIAHQQQPSWDQESRTHGLNPRTSQAEQHQPLKQDTPPSPRNAESDSPRSRQRQQTQGNPVQHILSYSPQRQAPLGYSSDEQQNGMNAREKKKKERDMVRFWAQEQQMKYVNSIYNDIYVHVCSIPIYVYCMYCARMSHLSGSFFHFQWKKRCSSYIIVLQIYVHLTVFILCGRTHTVEMSVPYF